MVDSSFLRPSGRLSQQQQHQQQKQQQQQEQQQQQQQQEQQQRIQSLEKQGFSPKQLLSLRSRLVLVLVLVVFLLLLPQAAVAQDGSDQLAAHVVKNSPAGDVRGTLATFIKFSEKFGLGMHLGKEKGDLIEYAVGQGLPESGPAVVFEMGCHSGDGTLNAIAALSERPGSTVISTEANKGWLEGAKRVVKHAIEGHETTFLPFLFHDDEDLELLLDTLRNKYGISQFDSVIFDHNEKLFLTHLKVIQARGFLKAGSTIYVDNVKRKGKLLRKYMEHVNTKSKRGYETEIKHVKKPYPDAVAISTWWGPTMTMEL